MSNVLPQDLPAIADEYKLKDVAWAAETNFGLLVGFTNGTSRYVRTDGPPPRSMNP